MVNSSFVNEAGVPIEVGAHGDHSFLYEEGVEVIDEGQSGVVFEAGTGLGGVSLSVEGTEIGFFESNETHTDWYGYNVDVIPNAEGLHNKGILNQSGVNTIYVIGHHDTGNDTYAIGYCSTHVSDVSEDAAHDSKFGGLTSGWTYTVKDGPEGSGLEDDLYETNASGEPIVNHAYGWPNGDGVMMELTGVSTEITLEYADNGEYTSEDRTDTVGQTNPITDAEEWRGRGPLADVDKAISGFGDTVTINVTVP